MPTYLITAPDGRKFRVTGEGSQDEALAAIQERYEKQEKPYDPTQDMGAGEKLLAGIGKGFVDLGRGTRQLSTELGNAMGLGYLSPRNFGDAEVERQRTAVAESRELDAPLMKTGLGKIGNLIGNLAVAAPTAFIPGANTVAGAGLVGAVLGALQPASSGQERAMSTALGGTLGSAGQFAGGKIMSAAGNKIASRADAASLAKSQNAVRDQVLKEAIDSGFVAPPSTTNPTVLNSSIESLAGKAATQSGASFKNQRLTNQLVRADLGIPDNVPLTRESLKAVRTDAGKVYEAIKGSGEVLADEQFLDDVVDIVGGNPAIAKEFPGAKLSADDDVVKLADSLLQEKFSAGSAVEYVKHLRSQAKTNFRTSYSSGGSPEKLKLAHAQWDAAGALEDAIERHLQKQGLGDLAQQFTQARTLIAKSHSAEAALNEGTGNVVANKLVQQMRKGKPMSGGFSKIAKFASAVPKAMTEPTQSGGVSALNAALYTGGAALGSPSVILIPVARLLAKKAALSRALQSRAVVPSYAPNAAGTALLRGGQGLGRIGGPLAASAYATEQ